MARPKKPAATTQGHGTNKSDLEKRMGIEQQMQGDGSKLESVPGSISYDDLATKYYLYLIETLKDANILSDLDKINLSLMAIDLAQMQRLNKIINDDGLQIEQETKNGIMKKSNPAIASYKGYVDHFGKMSTQFGLSPSARAQLSTIALEQDANANDPVSQILNN